MEKSLNDLMVGDPAPTGGGKIQDIVYQSEQFIVFLSEDYSSNWVTSEDYDGYPDDFGLITNRVRVLELLAENLFKGKVLRELNFCSAEGLARVLDDKKTTNANKVLDAVEETIKERGRQVLKIEFIHFSFLTTLVVMALLIFSWLARESFIFLLGQNAYEIILAVLCGGIGAFVSTFLRSLKFEGDIRVSLTVYRLDGFLRIFYGLIAGFVIALAVKSNMILGLINDLDNVSLSLALLGFIATVAGASESLIPSIIQKMEKQVSKD